MPRRTDARERMIRTAAALFRTQGFAATGWRQVIADSGAPWGSQAHHFPGGKEQLAVEAVALSGAGYGRLLRKVLRDQHPADAVAQWIDLAAAHLAATEWADGCPVATLTLETAHTSTSLAAACAGAYADWRTALTDAISARGLPEPEATSLATLTLAAFEGGMLLARAERSTTPLDTVSRELMATLRDRVP
ncbi:TetR/AcrR family transcriptional regulator [Pseudonocardia spinosispora]|uniref:TetR/AcrR family transcriptional regulator n=1 Tax=Pseudonocardia spinosispora TaxID=103441 RepID=UPI00048AE64B|nr:TetR family transcriptional regulator C-terminal domain-containing protein [Pseudonocardia spinosispora]